MSQHKFSPSENVVAAWAATGIFGDGDDWKSYRRVVIDLQAGHVPKMYIERLADDRLLGVGLSLEGVKISFSQRGS